MSQEAFAASLGTSASRLSTYRSGKVDPSASFYLRAVRLGEALGSTRERGWMTAPLTAATIAKALRAGDQMWAFKMALQGRDHLRDLLSEAPGLSGSWEAAPRSTGSVEWDSLLAGLVEHEFAEAGLGPTAWTQRPPLEEAWLLDSPRLDHDQIKQRTPEWLARRHIFVTEKDLMTA